jgi:hypothetical protein
MNAATNTLFSRLSVFATAAIIITMGLAPGVQAGNSTYTGEFYGGLQTNSGYTGTLTDVKVLFYDASGAVQDVCIPAGTVSAVNGVVDFDCDMAAFDMTKTDLVVLDSSQLNEVYYAGNASSTSMVLNTVVGNKIGNYSNDFGNGPIF